MAADLGAFWLLLILVGGGGGNDLLDYLDTQAYWKTKGLEPTLQRMADELQSLPGAGKDLAALVSRLGSEAFEDREQAAQELLATGSAALPVLLQAIASDNPEIATRAQVLVRQLQPRKMGQAVRRLMAIRALGESKDPAARPILERLLEQKGLFEAEYARRALLLLQGQGFERPSPTPAALQADLALLPAGCPARAQLVLRHGGPLDFTRILAEKKELPFADEAEGLLKEFQRQVLSLAEQIGNFRIEAATIGLAGDPDLETGQWTLVARCRYDLEAVRLAASAARLPEVKSGGLNFHLVEDHAALWLPGAERAGLLLAPGTLTASLKAFAEALQQPANQAPVQAAGPDGSGGGKTPATLLWAEVRLNEALRRLSPLLAPLEQLELRGVEGAEGALELSLRGKGQNPEPLQGAAKALETTAAQTLTLLEAGKAPLGPGTSRIVGLLKSLKVQTQGQEIQVGGRLQGSVLGLLLPTFLSAMGAQVEEEVPIPER